MLLGLVVYVAGGKYLPEQGRVERSARRGVPVRNAKATGLLLLGVGLAVTIFRGAYEQVGNTVALFADAGIDRATPLGTIPMTWFQALNPLLVFLMTPFLLARWKRNALFGRELSSMRKMACGASIVACAYVLLALAASFAGDAHASWIWLFVFFVVFTLGELYILPTGLGLFARLAPPALGATTIAGWFLAIFTGSLAAGVVGTLWSRMSHPAYFVILAAIAALAATLLLALDRATRRVEIERAGTLLAETP
jgi:POT family proton-dependent oligopeptide transporter